MALEGIYVNGVKQKFQSSDLLEDAGTDISLSQPGVPADAAATGNEIDALHQEVNRRENDNTSPIYIGDFMTDATDQHRCCVRAGDNVYSFVVTENLLGQALIFNLVENVQTNTVALDAGDVISCAYDNEHEIIYVASRYTEPEPEEETTEGEGGESEETTEETTSTEVQNLYKYDTSMEFIEAETIPVPVAGVSYDSAAGALYIKGNDNKLYRKVDTSWEEVDTVDLSAYEDSALGLTYDGDFAVHDSKIYFSSTRRSVLFGRIDGGEVVITGGVSCRPVDSTETYQLGELRGIEFDANGHLYAADSFAASPTCNNAFCVEIPVGLTPPMIPRLTGVLYDASLTLSAEAQAKFSLGRFELRSLTQLKGRVNKIERVYINGDEELVDDQVVEIFQDVTLRMTGTYKVNRIDVYSGTLKFFISDEGVFLIPTGSCCVQLVHNGRLHITANSNDVAEMIPMTWGKGSSEAHITSGQKCHAIIDVIPLDLDGGDFMLNATTLSKTGEYRNGFWLRPTNISYNYIQELTITRTDNPYVSAEQLRLIKAYRTREVLWFNGNLSLTSLPSDSTFYEIGRISDWDARWTVNINMKGQTSGATLLVVVTTVGEIQIYNSSGTTATGFFRCPSSVPARI